MLRNRIVRNGEPLAISPDALKSGAHEGRHAMWWMFGPETKPNERCGEQSDVAVVHISGSLEHRAGSGGDSYEGIIERVRCALTGEDDDEERGTPSTVVLRIDSPGGVVSGLTEAVRAIRALRAKHDIPLIAYVDELAASAAYAIACACDEILLPKSGIAGSVGVISTMYDQTAADEKMGLRFVTLTSGARKADGHPHVPLSADATKAEQGRVDRLALQFFKLVREARGLSIDAVRGLEAGIFLGGDAVTAGLADDVMTWDEVLQAASPFSVAQTKTASVASTRQPGKSGVPSSVPDGAKGSTMLMKIRARIASLTTKLADCPPSQRADVKRQLDQATADLAAATKIKERVETKETYSEESTDADEDAEAETAEAAADEGDDEGDDEDDDGDEEAEKAEAPPEKKSASAILAMAEKATGKRGRAAVGALAAKLAMGEDALARVATIERERRAERKASLIADAKNARRITPRMAKELASKPLSFVTGYLEMHKTAIVNVDDDSVRIPDPNAKAPELPSDVSAEVERAVSMAPDNMDKDKLRAALTLAHKTRLSSGAAAGSY